MVWTFLNLANHSEVVHRLESEVDSIFNETDELTTSTLSLLTYTEAVLKESLRLHQPVPNVIRKTVEDNTLTATNGKQIYVKKGTDIMINFYTLHQ